LDIAKKWFALPSYSYFSSCTHTSSTQASLFVRARGVLLLSKEDPGPRVLFEGLYANTPFLISDDVTIDPRIERYFLSSFLPSSPSSFSSLLPPRFGMRASMRSSHDLNQALKEFLVARMDLSSSALSFARELDENLELTKLIKRIENHYQVDLFEKRQKHS